MAGRSTRLRRVGIWSRPPTDRCYRATGELLTQTPEELLPTVCYLCQGLVAPEFAGVDLGLAERMALRAVATATRD
jgi:hypothetical protein